MTTKAFWLYNKSMVKLCLCFLDLTYNQNGQPHEECVYNSKKTHVRTHTYYTCTQAHMQSKAYIVALQNTSIAIQPTSTGMPVHYSGT